MSFRDVALFGDSDIFWESSLSMHVTEQNRRYYEITVMSHVWMNRVFSRPVALLVVTMETVGQTNQSCVMIGSPLYLTIRSAGSSIG